MTRDELRLELLKLTYIHGRTSAEAVERAREMEVFVLDNSSAAGSPLKKGPGRPRKTDREPPLFE